MSPSARLRERVAEILPEIVEVRHSLHRIPEIHFQERQTCAAIRAFLSGSSLEILPPLLGTDTVGFLKGGSEGPCILLRSDIDALPVQERTGAAWASERPCCAHACGHDGHMAILLGTVKVLETFSRDLSGSVLFVFQPAEEEAAGGKALIEKGLLETDPRPTFAFALHGWPGVPVGCLSSASGPAMAAADTFLITVRGRGGHAAYPHHAADPVLTAAHVVTGLQSVVSRSVDPQDSVVLSVCRIEGGKASNVIPDEVILEGTTRYFDQSLQAMLRTWIRRIAEGICSAAGCTAEVVYQEGYAPLVNHESAVDFARGVVNSYLGPTAWFAEHHRAMTAEDFAFYLERVPGALLRLGLGENWQPLHSADFDFNDQSLQTGILALSGLALELCRR